MTGPDAPARDDADRTPRWPSSPAALRAIQASPAAVGCRPSRARGNTQLPASGSMMITPGSAARAAVTIASSIR